MLPCNQPFPVPYIQIDKTGSILAYSETAAELFDMQEGHILALIDEESKEKVRMFMFEQDESLTVEANVKTKINPIQLFDLHLSWDEQATGHIVLLSKEQRNGRLEDRLLALQERLSSTDFELLEKKDELEKTLVRLRELSGPFITLSAGLAFIPLFGDITKDKIEAIMGQALRSAYEGEYSRIAVDFTAVGKIEEEGVHKLLELFKMLKYMNGVQVEVVGMKPQHSQIMNSFQRDWPFSFAPSLAYILQEK